MFVVRQIDGNDRVFAHRGVKVWFHPFLTYALDGDERSAILPVHLTPQ